MPITLYEISIPVFIRGLENLSGVLSKAVVNAIDKPGLSEFDLIEARLYEDMGALPFQIQRCSDTARNSAVRISDSAVPNVSMPDSEATFAELQDRISKTIAFLKGIRPEDINGKEDLRIKLGNAGLEYTGSSYMTEYALPNFFFHVTTAYDILRSKGIPVGKRDYLGWRN